jgi:hypothetical protein
MSAATERKSYRTITITEKDIERAHRNNSYKCVVAQAIARTLPDAHHIEVDTQTIRFTDRHERKAFLTPYAVQGYVVAFDAGDQIVPFSFQLRNPVPVRQPKMTAGGKLAHQASVRARRRARKSGSNATVAAREAYAAVKAAHPGPTNESTNAPARPAPPRVFKTKQRTYGMRVLRINQQAAAQANHP